MQLDRLILKKNEELNMLKNKLCYREEGEDREKILEDIKTVIEDLDIILQEEKKLEEKLEVNTFGEYGGYRGDNDEISDIDNRASREFTLADLANYDGKNGAAAYVAIDGTVYDVTGILGFEDGNHFGVKPGTDGTESFRQCHNGDRNILNKLRMVGVLRQ